MTIERGPHKTAFLTMLSVVTISTSFSSPARAGNSLNVLARCHLASNPDAGVNVEIVDAGSTTNSNLLVAIVTSAGNVLPHVLGAFPVSVIPNGAGIITYKGTDFLLTKSTWTRLITLKSGGAEPVDMSGSGIGYSCE